MTRLFAAWARDLPLVAVAFALSVFGLAMIYSAGVTISPQAVVAGAWLRQLVWFGLALVTFTVVSRLPARWLEEAALPAYVLSLVILAATLVVGTGAGTAAGTKSSIMIGPVRFQPAEVAKLATILILARTLSVRGRSLMQFSDLIGPAVLAGIPLMLVLAQPDLGTAQAFAGILFAMLFWAGAPPAFLLLLASPLISLIVSFDTRVWSVAIIALLALLFVMRSRLSLVESFVLLMANVGAGTIGRPLWNSLAAYQQNRLLVFLDPQIDPRGAGYHVIQSKVAIGNGGFFGEGFTLGSQKRYDFLPEQHTDFIFAVVGEELGFVGVLVALAAFGFLLLRLLRLAEASDRPFAGLVLLGILGAWLVHIFVNIGMTVGVVPITGIPLPFVSYGGSFLLMSWLAVAIAAGAASDDS